MNRDQLTTVVVGIIGLTGSIFQTLWIITEIKNNKK